jgi:hypothetical protein
MEPGFDFKVQRVAALSGLIAMLVAGAGQFGPLLIGEHGWNFMHPSAAAPAKAVAKFWADNHHAAMFSTACFELAWAILILWCIQYSLQLLRLSEGLGARILAVFVALNALTIPFLMMVVTAFWTIAGFRAGETDPEITQAFSDLGYLGSYIWFWTAIVTMAGGGMLMLRYQQSRYAFPRWIAWASIIGGITQLPATFVHFFHDGIWSFNGLLGWYIPLIGWFVWMLVVSPLMFRMVEPIERTGPGVSSSSKLVITT